MERVKWLFTPCHKYQASVCIEYDQWLSITQTVYLNRIIKKLWHVIVTDTVGYFYGKTAQNTCNVKPYSLSTIPWLPATRVVTQCLNPFVLHCHLSLPQCYPSFTFVCGNRNVKCWCSHYQILQALSENTTGVSGQNISCVVWKGLTLYHVNQALWDVNRCKVVDV